MRFRGNVFTAILYLSSAGPRLRISRTSAYYVAMTHYTRHAKTLFAKYSQMDSAALHRDWTAHLPTQPGLACDIGAGSGRDANWLAEQGWDVIAVEPEASFREQAKTHNHPNVSWLDDRLPELGQLRKLNQRFNLILLSAVWMHVLPAQRERAFRILTNLLAPGGLLVISLRHGTDEAENQARKFYPVSVGELEQLARCRAVSLLSVTERADYQDRAHVQWQSVVLQVPDDGTGSLPLLRHIIVNDDKSATYKLGLLRTLLRIADGAPGMVLRHSDDYVEIPFGLVGLYWIKLYMPLVLTANLIQSPSHKPVEYKGLGFAKPDHFYKMGDWSPYDLRVGSSFEPERAAILHGAIKDACANIQQMPAHFITYPGQNRQVFECALQSTRHKSNSHWRIDKESLSEFGGFRVPLALWQTLSQYACWIEPAILNEWARLMDGYVGVRYDRSVYDRAFQWEDARRNTQQVRQIATQVQDRLTRQNQSLQCVWSGSRLRESFEIDHCFPWSRWYNNDLWNLLPTSRSANNEKRERLPSAALMHEARERIKSWWELAFAEESLQRQFMTEAQCALPLVGEGSQSLDRVYDGMLYQRARLKMDQGLVEWHAS